MKLNLQKLNNKQIQAVQHVEGPLLLLAGAGSGKTTTMAYRIAYLVSEKKIPAKSILGLSFTRKAANELSERVRGLITQTLGPSHHHGIILSTFHSLCARILRKHATLLGYTKEFSILDDSDQKEIIRDHLRTMKLDDRKFDPSFIQFEIGQAKNHFISPSYCEDYFFNTRKLKEDYATILIHIFEKYQNSLKTLQSFDFDDLLFKTVEMLESNHSVSDQYNHLFKFILVDEYQDTNPAQFRLLNILTKTTKNIAVVGDDDQSIYGWRGADSAHILNFSNHFSNAKIITMDQNYRSTKTILDAANSIISNNPKRHPKSLWSQKDSGEPIELVIAEDDRDESDFVGDDILMRARSVVDGRFIHTQKWSDFAILYRSNTQARIFEESLRIRQIPYKIVGGTSFLERKEIKNALCFLKLVSNPKDNMGLRRIINWPSRGIGKSSLDHLNTLSAQHGLGIQELYGHPSLKALLTPKSFNAFNEFISKVAVFREEFLTLLPEPSVITLSLKTYLEKICEIKKGLSEDCEDPAEASRRMENVDELLNAFGQFKPDDAKTSVEVLVQFLELMSLEKLDQESKQNDENEDSKNKLTLITLHGAKGLEFHTVYLVGWEEGLLPHRRVVDEGGDLTEERRLAYVGVTRAKDRLIITRAQNRIRYGKSVPRTPSRYIEEIPQNLIIKQNRASAPDLNTQEALTKHEVKVKDFLSAIRNQISSPTKP